MSDWLRAWHRYRRQNRFLIAAFLFLLVLSLAAVYLLQRTQSASPEELTNRLLLFVLWYLDISLILVLSFILVRNLVRLALERRSGVLGSRFRTKLVLTYVALTFMPVIFIFLIATNFLQRSIDQWFSSPVEEILRSGAAVSVQLRELVEARLTNQAAVAADELGGPSDAATLDRLRRTMGVDLLALFEGERLVEAVADAREIPISLPPLRWDRLPATGVRAERWRASLLVRAWHPVGRGGRVVVVGDVVPRDLLVHLDRANAMEAEFQEMKMQRGTFTSTSILVFLAVTLLLLFATVWMGLYLSRRFTEPLLAVAAATQRVAEGNELEEVTTQATDEVALLVRSFNAMVRRVRATEEEILASNQELATLLGTIPTGVLSLDAERRRFRPNPAAARMLGEDSWMGRWLPLEALDRPGLEELAVQLSNHLDREASFELQLEAGGSVRHVDVTITPLAGGGSVVAIDDLTQLVRAQRQAAWSEVAQRIAHEIRNPLTPIRLAAERIQRRAGRLGGELDEVVTAGCEAIVAHVSGLKELVDAFHEYARLPPIEPRPCSLSRIVREVWSLYRGLRAGLEVRLAMPAGEVVALVDPAQLRQALVNLLDNAVDAVGAQGLVELAVQLDGDLVTIEIADDGVGFPTDDEATLVQPFYSTKGRGSGMGLALVHRVVTDHGGTLELTNRRPRGAAVRIILPHALVGDPDAAEP